jgi:putative membrane protein
VVAIAKLILTFTANLTAVFLTAYFVSGFQITTNVSDLLTIILVITVVNLTIKPLINLALSPLIFITFGLFTIATNTAIIYAIDIYSESLTITGLWPLVESSHIISIINIIINYAALYLYRGSDIS